MGQVIGINSTKPTAESLTEDLERKGREMEKLYSQLDAAYEAIGDLEDVLHRKEDAYNSKFRQLTAAIPLEEVSMEIVQFATCIKFDIDPVTSECTVSLQDED